MLLLLQRVCLKINHQNLENVFLFHPVYVSLLEDLCFSSKSPWNATSARLRFHELQLRFSIFFLHFLSYIIAVIDDDNNDNICDLCVKEINS